SGYQQKDRKPSQNDKTEHGMEKTVQNQGQSPKMPKLREIQFLGYVINGDGIHVDPSKIEVVKNWKALRTLYEVRSFLGLARYYEQENAFQTLKGKLCDAPVLALPDGPEDFVIELFSDYDCEIRYHPGMANVVADVLSRKERVKPKRVRAMNMTFQSSIKDRILAAQKEACDESAGLQKGLDEMIEHRSDGALYYLDRIWVHLKGDVRTLIIDEAYKSKYSVHLGVDRIYYDLGDRYWWSGMKKDIVVYVSRYLTCLKVKAEHQRPSGLLQQPEIPEWKWERIVMDFVTKLPRTSSGHDTIWGLCGSDYLSLLIFYYESCSNVVAFLVDIEFGCLRVYPIVNAPAGRLLGAYDLGIAIPRALVHAGDKTSGDARSCYMISGDAKSWVVIVLYIFTIILHNCPTV
ncbi:putative reverse transcriptase domain-containing protein, partial [Tanacetum coccineum]